MAHDEPTPTNSTLPRSLDGIYMRPISTAQGGHEILHLATNSVITRRHVTVLPITQAVIQSVEALAKRDGMKPFRLATKHGVILYDALTAGVDGDDDEDDNSTNQPDDDDATDDDDSDDIDDDDDDDQDDDQDDMDPNDIYDDPNTEQDQQPVKAQDDNDEENESEDEEDDEDDEQDDRKQQEDEIGNEFQPTLRRSTRIATQTTVPNITSLQGKTYGSAFNQTIEPDQTINYDEDEAKVIAMIMTQFNERVTTTVVPGQQHLVTYSLKKGLERFGERGTIATQKEMQQLIDRKCFVPIRKSDLNETEMKRALESLIFITEKKNGIVKTRHCANGSTQRSYMEREEVSSPTVSTDSTLLTSVIEAEEGRDVATCDIPNAFIQTEVPKSDKDGNRTIMKIRGILVKILCTLEPTYSEYVVKERESDVLYVHVHRAIYGMMISSLLFYQKLTGDLVKYGFQINPYDPCVANKMVNTQQLTISWHIDDLKISHAESKTVDDFISWVNQTYGELKPVTTTRGKLHEYLGMKLDYTTDGQVTIDMVDYVQSMVMFFPEQLEKPKVASPWTDQLFTVNTKSPMLDRPKAELFHTMVAKALFLCKRGRPDISPAVAFLTTRVQQPNVDDWEKLIRMMRFLRQTSEDRLTLRADGSKSVKWMVDASFAVHPDFKSHTGATMTMGKGAISSISRKQRMNTRSSTEAELVAADDVVGSIIWTKLFLEAQGYPMTDNVLYQDNRSAILLETNGRQSVGKRSRHLNIRLFFVADQKEKGNLSIEFCPTDKMTGDYMTKPVHGQKFRDFRQEIMNLPVLPFAAQMVMTAVANPKK
jgi:hypothetical protein